MEFRIKLVKVCHSCISAYQVDVRRWWFPIWLKDGVWSTREKAEQSVMTMKESLSR